MKVRLSIEVDDRDRYVIRRYFAKSHPNASSRTTREEVKKFIEGMLRLSIREQADALTSRARATAKRLSDPDREMKVREKEITPPKERDMDLLW